jgi:CRP-like cAMP-binding protein
MRHAGNLKNPSLDPPKPARPATAPAEARLTQKLLEENAILRGLPPAVAKRIMADGELVSLSLRQQIYEPEVEIRDVFFPLDSVLSIVTRMKDGSQIEVGTIGREGVSALPLLMGASSTANDSYCQVRGRAIRINADLFTELSGTNLPMRQLLDRYLQAYVNMLGQLAACNRLHSVYERCSRWLLSTHDRVGSDTIYLTHEYLAMMLGTGRSGVTIAVGILQQAGFIRSAHGVITVLDREGLENATCECYAVAREQFSGVLRPVTASGVSPS